MTGFDPRYLGKVEVVADSSGAAAGLPAALGPAAPAASLSIVAAQSTSSFSWAVAVTSTAKASIRPWTAGATYAIGEAVTNDSGKVYRCKTAGTAAGSGGPTGTGADITDNAAHWSYELASLPTFKGGIVVGNRSTSANPLDYGGDAGIVVGSGMEIAAGGSPELYGCGDATALFLVSAGATAMLIGYP